MINYAAVNQDYNLDIQAYERLLDKVEQEIHLSPDRVRHTMNGFVIAIGCSIQALTEKALQISDSVGTVEVDMNGTSCKVSNFITKCICLYCLQGHSANCF